MCEHHTIAAGLLIYCVCRTGATVQAWLGEAVAAGLDTRCGFSDSLSKEDARQTFERMVAMGVVEVSCGRPDWIAEFIAAH